MRRSYIICSAIAVLIIISGFFSDDPTHPRGANPHEEFYRYIAQEINEPALCDKISWDATLPGGFFSDPSFYRSACYNTIAGNTHTMTLCAKVRRLGAFRPLSNQLSIASCMGNAWHDVSSGIAVSDAVLIGFFSEMGYNPDTLSEEHIMPPLIRVRDYYRKMAKDPQSIARAKALLSGPDLAPQYTPYLADMVAIADNDGAVCERIPRASRLNNWCIFTVASNTQDAALCDKISSAVEKAPKLPLRSSCLFQIHPKYPSKLRYGAELPDKDADILAIMALLDFQLPRAKDLPENEVYQFYNAFLHRLTPPTSRAFSLNKNLYPTENQRLAARARFMERMNHMPSYP